jgi:hypothetical protein
MFTTREVLALLRTNNPDRTVTEDLIRSTIRRDRVHAPSTIAGRFLWSIGEIKTLAEVLNLTSPKKFESTIPEARS